MKSQWIDTATRVPQQDRSGRHSSRTTQRGRGHVYKRRIEVVATFVVDGADKGTTLQTGQRLHLLCWPCTGVSELDLAEWHVLPAQAECHVSARVAGARERHRQVTPQQPLQFGQALESGPGDQTAVFGLDVRGVCAHHQGNAITLAGAPGRDDAQVVPPWGNPASTAG